MADSTPDAALEATSAGVTTASDPMQATPDPTPAVADATPAPEVSVAVASTGAGAGAGAGSGAAQKASARRGDPGAPRPEYAEVAIKPEFLPSDEEMAKMRAELKASALPDPEAGKRDGVKASYSGGKKRSKTDRGAVKIKLKVCNKFLQTGVCNFGDKCKFLHDAKVYLDAKGPDLGPTCYMYEKTGHCKFGIQCRYGGAHIDKELFRNISKPEAEQTPLPETMNALSSDLLFALRRRQYVFKRAPNMKKKGRKDKRGRKGKRDRNQQAKEEAVKKEAEAKEAAQKEERATADAAAAGGTAPAETAAGAGAGAGTGAGAGAGAAADADGDVAMTTSGTSVAPVAAAPAATVNSTGNATASAAEVPTKDATSEPAAKKARAEDGSVVPASATPAAKSSADDVAKRAAAVTEPEGDDVPMRREERKHVDFNGKVYIAPLTTVGNLPFRRICKDLGADITVGEMAVATSVLSGNVQECSLLKRHPSEDVFGVQIATPYPDAAARVSELIDDYTSVDFVDLNMGCPLPGIMNKGMGSGLMRRANRMMGIAREANKYLSCDFTVKMRVGVSWKECVATKLIHKARTAGVRAVAVHGRSAFQRYTKFADWDYISKCVEAGRDVLYCDDGNEAPAIPIIGNGDILHQSEFYDHIRNTGVATCMLARGVLIKPWLCTEIKEQRVWDISSKERFDILRNFTNYGLEHWGSDDRGVNNTRRFLLEWLSFLNRYVPVGLLERTQQLNQRPPIYHGRDYLETLMPEDWVRISEMLLGPVPEGFRFVPKHKANSYAALARAAAASSKRKDEAAAAAAAASQA